MINFRKTKFDFASLIFFFLTFSVLFENNKPSINNCKNNIERTHDLKKILSSFKEKYDHDLKLYIDTVEKDGDRLWINKKNNFFIIFFDDFEFFKKTALHLSEEKVNSFFSIHIQKNHSIYSSKYDHHKNYKWIKSSHIISKIINNKCYVFAKDSKIIFPKLNDYEFMSVAVSTDKYWFSETYSKIKQNLFIEKSTKNLCHYPAGLENLV